MMPPVAPLGRNNIFPELIDPFVEMHRFRKIVPSRRDLIDRISVCNYQLVRSQETRS